MLLAMVTLLMTVASVVYLLVLGGTVGATYLFAALLLYWKLLLLTAMAVLLSSLTSPILGALIVFSVYLIGHATNILVDLPVQIRDTATGRMLSFVYYVLPNLSNFDLSVEAANGVPVATSYVVWAMLYGTVYTAMLLGLASLAFEDKDV